MEAGRELAQKLKIYRDSHAVVYALPRGGVVVGAEVARELGVPLDLVIARKIGHPSHAEYAIAAVTETGQPVVNEFELLQVSEEWFDRELDRQRTEAKRRREKYFGDLPHTKATHRTAIIIDDGIATGLTLKAAIVRIKDENPAKIVVAVPVTPDDTAAELEKLVDEFVCLHREQGFFGAVGSYYRYFDQTADDEVVNLLHELE